MSNIEEINGEKVHAYKKVVPKEIGQRCPVCNSWGTIKGTGAICHGCGGLGYILVPAGEVTEIVERRQHEN